MAGVPRPIRCGGFLQEIRSSAGEIWRFRKVARLLEMDQFGAKSCDCRCFQRTSMAMPSIGLLEHAQRLHQLARQKLPPTCKQQCRVVDFVSNLGDRATSSTDIAVVAIQDEDPTKSEMKDISQNVCKVHGHHFRTNVDGAPEMSCVCWTLGELYSREQ